MYTLPERAYMGKFGVINERGLRIMRNPETMEKLRLEGFWRRLLREEIDVIYTPWRIAKMLQESRLGDGGGYDLQRDVGSTADVVDGSDI